MGSNAWNDVENMGKAEGGFSKDKMHAPLQGS